MLVLLVPILLVQDPWVPQRPPERAPLGLPALPTRTPSAAVFALGKRLFFDPILSTDRTVSCASCHRPEHGYSTPERLPRGALGRRALRHPPTLWNRVFGERQMWDGRAASLEEQVLLPIANPNEMALPLDRALTRLRADPGHAEAFARAFGAPPDRRRLAAALSAFVRGLTFGDSRVDRFLAGERDALTRSERAGMWIWESKGGCWRCHPRPLYTDEGFHNTGVGARDGHPEPGRAGVTGDPEDRGRFKTPTLRGVALRGPYMHDGSLATLEDVVAFYRRGGNPNERLSPRLAPLDLTDREAADLVAFLRALSPAPVHRPAGK